MEFTVRFRISEFELHAYKGRDRDHHAILAIVGSKALHSPATNRILCSRLEAGPQEFDLTFTTTDMTAQQKHRFPVAVMMQLHTHRESDDGELIEINAATGSEYLWLWQLAEGPVDLAVRMLDYPAILEREVFESVDQRAMDHVEKAKFRIECTAVTAIPSALLRRKQITLDHFTQTFSDNVIRRFHADANRIMQTFSLSLKGLFDYDTFLYDVGAGIRVPSGVMVANRSYVEPCAEVLHERRLVQVLEARGIALDRFAARMRAILQRFEAYDLLVAGRSAAIDAQHMAPNDEDLEMMNVVVEGLLTMPTCALPYTHDRSEVSGEDYVEVEQIDNNKCRRAFDCEDTATEISMTHEDLVRNCDLWRTELVRLSARFLRHYECVVTRVVTRPTEELSTGKVELQGSTLHVCAILVLNHHLYRWIQNGTKLHPNLLHGLDVSQDVVLATAKSIAYKPAWWYRYATSDRADIGHPSRYYSTEFDPPTLTNLHNITPPGRAVLLADGCSAMLASQGPPQLTHPESPHYFTEVERLRERIYSGILGRFRDLNLDHQFPLEWRDGDRTTSKFGATDSTTRSQSHYYDVFTSFSVRNPLLDAWRDYGSDSVPSTARTQNTTTDYVFVNNEDGTLGVKFDALFTSELPASLMTPKFSAVPRATVPLSLIEMCVDAVALQEPVYPMYLSRATTELARDIQHACERESGSRTTTNVFAEFPLHIAKFDCSVIHAILDYGVEGLGRPTRHESMFIGVGSPSKIDRSGFINESPVRVDLAGLGIGLIEIQKRLGTADGRRSLIEMAGADAHTNPELWYLKAYDKVLQELLGVFFTRFYYSDVDLVGHVTLAANGEIPQYHM